MRLPADAVEWFVAACIVGLWILSFRGTLGLIELAGAFQWAGF